MSTETVRDALADAAAGISGLRSSPYHLDSINPPIAVVTPGEFDPRLVFGQGKQVRPFIVTVYAGRTTEVHAQKLLDTYTELSGATSLLAALQATAVATAAGADYVEVTEVSGLQVVPVGEINYLAVQWTVEVCY